MNFLDLFNLLREGTTANQMAFLQDLLKLLLVATIADIVLSFTAGFLGWRISRFGHK